MGHDAIIVRGWVGIMQKFETNFFGLVVFALLYGVADVQIKIDKGYYKRFERWNARLIDMVSDALTPLFIGIKYVFYVVSLILVLSFF